MINFIEQAIRLVWGDYAFTTYPTIFEPLLHIMLFVFAILIVVLTFKLWKWLLFGWWR